MSKKCGGGEEFYKENPIEKKVGYKFIKKIQLKKKSGGKKIIKKIQSKKTTKNRKIKSEKSII